MGPPGVCRVCIPAASSTATPPNPSAKPTIHSERKKFAACRPIALRLSNERQIIVRTATSATHQSRCCHGRGVQITVRISPKAMAISIRSRRLLRGARERGLTTGTACVCAMESPYMKPPEYFDAQQNRNGAFTFAFAREISAALAASVGALLAVRYSRITAGSASRPRVVSVMAAARISAPPSHA